MKNIFVNDPRGQHKRCGMAILSQNLILQLSEIYKVRENKAMGKFPSIMVLVYWNILVGGVMGVVRLTGYYYYTVVLGIILVKP